MCPTYFIFVDTSSAEYHAQVMSPPRRRARCSFCHTVPLGLEGRSKFKELLAAGAPRHPIGRFRPRRPGGSGTFSNFELWAPEVAF